MLFLAAGVPAAAPPLAAAATVAMTVMMGTMRTGAVAFAMLVSGVVALARGLVFTDGKIFADTNVELAHANLLTAYRLTSEPSIIKK